MIAGRAEGTKRRLRAARRAGAAALLGILLSAKIGRPAESEVAPVRVVYDAPSTCPDADAFKTQIRNRTARFRESDRAGVSRTFVVSIRQTDRGWSGTLELIDARAQRSSRALVGASCDEVVGALSLMAALAIDPLARTSPVAPSPSVPQGAVAPGATPSPSSSPSAPEPNAPPPSAAPPEGAGAAKAQEPSTPKESSERSSARTEPPALHSSPGGWRLSGGVGADAAWGIAPEAMIGPRVAVDLSSPYRGFVGLSLRVAFERAVRDDVQVTGGAAHFAWTFGTLDACPLRWSPRPLATLALYPCVRVEAGQLDAYGIGVVPVRDASRGWVALSALGRVRWTLVEPFSVEVEGGLRAPLVRDRFIFEPDITVYQPPSVSGFLGGGLLVTFL